MGEDAVLAIIEAVQTEEIQPHQGCGILWKMDMETRPKILALGEMDNKTGGILISAAVNRDEPVLEILPVLISGLGQDNPEKVLASARAITTLYLKVEAVMPHRLSDFIPAVPALLNLLGSENSHIREKAIQALFAI